jgi:type VI secretion system protein ImpK
MLGDPGLIAMSTDDPFGLHDPSQRTAIIRPRPGGMAPASAAAYPPMAAEPAVAWPGMGSSGTLLKAAEPLLALAPRLRTHVPPRDVDHLYAKVKAEVERFTQNASSARLPPDEVAMGRYALCALLDDIVLNTPWGPRSRWPSQRLAAVFHQDVDAGRGFFRELEQAERAPERHHDLLELMYACLAMGFEGVYRINPPPGRTLQQIKEDLYRLLGRFRSHVDRSLSPNWQGSGIALAPEQRGVPPWTAGVAGLALLAILYAGFSYRLSGYGDDVAYDLPSAEPVQLARAGIVPPPAPPLPPSPVVVQATQSLEGFLAAEQREGLVEVFDRGRDIVVLLRGEGLFDSGSAEIRPRFLPTIARIGQAVEDRPGIVQVVGHSDNVPIRTARFPSNWELSRARAASVAAGLAREMSDSSRLRADGLADTQPIASNATPEGQRRNRRIEIIVPR